MAGIMRMHEEWEERGYSAPDGTVCSSCVTDDALVATVRLEGDSRICDQCGQAPVAPDATVDLERVVQIVAEGLLFEYDDPINESHWESAEAATQSLTSTSTSSCTSSTSSTWTMPWRRSQTQSWATSGAKEAPTPKRPLKHSSGAGNGSPGTSQRSTKGYPRPKAKTTS